MKLLSQLKMRRRRAKPSGMNAKTHQNAAKRRRVETDGTRNFEKILILILSGALNQDRY